MTQATGEGDPGLRVGGVEIALRSDRPALLAEYLALLESIGGYRRSGGPADIVHEYRALPGYRPDAPVVREYPGYECRALSATRYQFWRNDSGGIVDIPTDPAAPVASVFEGVPVRWNMEASLRVAASLALPRQGGLVLHSSGVAFDPERALLFTGVSGAGKTTILELIRGARPSVTPLGDDLVLMRPAADGSSWIAHATPFAGALGPVPEHQAPLRGIYFLRQASRHQATRVSRTDALRRLLPNVLAYVAERTAAARVLAAAADVVAQVPCWDLEFAKDSGVLAVLDT